LGSVPGSAANFSDVRELRKYRVESEKLPARTEQKMAEIAGKLDALIDKVIDIQPLQQSCGNQAGWRIRPDGSCRDVCAS